MPNVGQLTAYLEMDISRLQKGARQGRNELSRFSKSGTKGISTITSSVVKLGAVLGGLASVFAAYRLIKDITAVGEAFEQSITTAGAVMRATTEEMQALNDIAREMGETTEFTASQAAESLKFLGMAGFEASKAIAALPDTLDLATAGGVDLSRAADIATNALTAMRLPVEQLSRVNDVFVGTITRSNTNMEQMAQAFKYAAPIAAAYGYEVEELSGLIGTLGNAGVQGSMAGTQLAQAFIEAKDIAREFGFESSDLVDVLSSLKERFGENVDMMEFFTKRAGRAALILGVAGDEVIEFQETLGGVSGEAKALADVMRSTFGGIKKELISVMESIKLDAFGLYRDALKGSIQDTIKWLRENKEEILAWAQALITGFKEIWTVASSVIKLVAKFISGVTDIYVELERQSGETTDALLKDSERLRKAFEPASIEPWEEMLNALENAGKATVDALLFVAKSVGIIIGAITKTIVNDLILNVLEALWEFAGVIERLAAWDFSGAGDKAIGVFTNLADIIKDTDKTAGAVMRSIGKAFDEMVAGFDFRSVRDKIIDVEFQAALTGDVVHDIGTQALAAHRGRKGLVHTAKDPGVSVFGDSDEIKAVTKTAHEMLNIRVALLSELLDAEGKSKEERMAIWNDYQEARIGQLIEEHEAMLAIGVDATLASKISAKRMAELNDEQKDLFTEQADWLKEWAAELSEELNATFSDMFFDTMKGEWQGLMEYMSGIWDIFLRKIADSAADELSNIFGGSDDGGGIIGAISGLFGGGGGGTDALSAHRMAIGGLVNRPTLAVIGESGPEVVIPLNKMRDENFLNNFGGGGGSGGNVSITVQTPDLPSFQRSQQQIMTQTAVALRQARMRNA